MPSYESSTERLGQNEPQTCSLVQDLLPLYLEGEVSPQTRDLIVEHLAHCDRCAGFLAGAQSVRVQLRRDQAQRQGVAADDQPARQMFSQLHWIVVSAATLLFCGLGAAGVLIAMMGMRTYGGFGPDNLAAGLIGGGFIASSYAMLMWLARARAALTANRRVMLLVSCALGAFGTLLLPNAPFPGLPVAFLGLVGVFVAVFSDIRPTAAPQPGTQM